MRSGVACIIAKSDTPRAAPWPGSERGPEGDVAEPLRQGVFGESSLELLNPLTPFATGSPALLHRV